jgi:RNA polymerase sigma-70 factor (ECF subfamily)
MTTTPWAQLFGDTRGEAAPGRPPTELEALLTELIAHATAVHPGLAVDPEAFVIYLASRLAATELTPQRAEDLYLACACSRGDPAAIALFEARYLAQLPRVTAMLEYQADLVDEVRQRLRVRLFVADATGGPAKIGQYSGQGPLAAWIDISADHTALNLLRQRAREDGGASIGDLPALPAPTPEAQLARARYGTAFAQAFRLVIGELSARERNLLRMKHLENLTIDDLAAFYRVHRATAARWMISLQDKIWEETVQKLATTLALPFEDCASLVVALRSELDVSIAQALTPAA